MNEKMWRFLKKLCLGVAMPMMLFAAAALLWHAGTQRQTTRPDTTGAPEASLLTVLTDTGARQMALESYLVGVLLGEMPTSFELEALKAQAVAARTYALQRAEAGQPHGACTVCTNATCCQAFTDPMDYLAGGGTEAGLQRARQAVQDTAGQVITYDGALIVSTFFCCAGDATEDAAAVWGEDYPYLRSVPSPGEEDTAFYTETKTFSPQEFQQALGVRLEGGVDSWFGEMVYTNGGGVESLAICGIPFQGTTLRQLLQLRSTAFAVTVRHGQILIRTKGYGHRVGLSQYGANAMAKEGEGYKSILTYYYQGTEIVQYSDISGKDYKIFS